MGVPLPSVATGTDSISWSDWIIPTSPHHVLGAGDLQHPATHIVVTVADGVDDFLKRDVVSQKLVGIEFHLILLDEASHTGHFSDTRHRLQPVTQIPVLKGAKLSQVVAPGFVNQCVFKYPSHPGSIGAQYGGGTFG